MWNNSRPPLVMVQSIYFFSENGEQKIVWYIFRGGSKFNKEIIYSSDFD